VAQDQNPRSIIKKKFN